MLFHNRTHAGHVLAGRLSTYAGRPDVLVLGLPRGGVPVAYEIARVLGAPLDVFLVRKLGVPGQEELAMGAIASGGVRVLNEETVRALGISEEAIDEVAEREQEELERRQHAYRADRPPPDVHGRTVILVDDGLATGSTMRAAIVALRQLGPARIVVAVPVASVDTCAEVRKQVDALVCVRIPEPYYAVGFWYADFRATTDEEVCDLLARAAAGQEREAQAVG
jgi:putative phosphoribosyl transferase